jgi:amidase
VPAAVCGLVGIKPSRGRVSASPYTDRLSWQNGPIARTVADAAALLDVMAGYETGDAWSAPAPERTFLAETSRTPKPLRIAISFGGISLRDDLSQTVIDLATMLEELGHHVEEADPANSWAVPLQRERLAAEAGHAGVNLSQYPTLSTLSKVDLEVLDPVSRYLLEAGVDYSAKDYVQRIDSLALATRTVVHFWNHYDVLMTPVVASEPLRIGAARDGDPLDVLEAWENFAPFTELWNATGQPALSLPAGFDAKGLPVGVQLVGPPAGEAVLIRLAAQVEAARPWDGEPAAFFES